MSAIYPAAPWQMQGQLWLSLFRLPRAAGEGRPAGVYGLAFVSYQEGSVLTYSELLAARPVKEPVKGVSITDIWVDSPASEAGGRELWAIPKGLGTFTQQHSRTGPMESVLWSASIEGRPVARARFTDATRLGARLPFRGATWQPGLTEGVGAGGGDRSATLRGSAKSLPCRGSWDLAPDGPLGWLAPSRGLASFRMADFRMSFG